MAIGNIGHHAQIGPRGKQPETVAILNVADRSRVGVAERRDRLGNATDADELPVGAHVILLSHAAE